MAKKRQKRQTDGKAVIYARYSSHNQREASLEQQISECRKYAEKNGYTISEVYQDAAISGRTDERPAFKRMMKDAEKEKFDYIICWKSNRIGRNMTQAMTNMAKLAEYGVECIYTEEDFDNTASGRFALRNMMNVNQFYSENMAEDITRGLMDNAEKCMVNGRVPLGYKKGPDGKYAIDEPAAQLVREIFYRFKTGWIIADIMADLNNRGITTRDGKPWKFQSFDKLLQNEQYTGVYKYSTVRIEGGIPAIIDKKTFEEVQHILATKKRPRGRKRSDEDYFLVGKCFCGKCGAPMTGLSGTGRNGKHCYYACNNKWYEHSCDKKNIPKELLERSVAEEIIDTLQNDELIEWIIAGYEKMIQRIKEESKVSTLESQLADVNKALDNLMKAMEAGLYNDVAIKRMNELADTKKDLEQAIAAEENALETYSVENLRTFLYGFRDRDLSDPENIRDTIETFVQAVIVFDGDDYRIRFNYGIEKDAHLRKCIDVTSGENGSCVVNQAPPKDYLKNQSAIERTTLERDYFEIVALIRKRESVV